jgi:large repetitive protein
LRNAVSQGNRTIVFDVGGVIELARMVLVRGAFVTIDGFSAPPPGITLRGGALFIRGDDGAHDVIVRGIRVRGASMDGIAISSGAYNVVIDHVSVHGSGDGNLDITENAHDVTVSWSIFAAPTFDKNMLVKFNASRISLHHNLFTDSTQRNPLVSTDNAATPPSDTTADIRNNLVANWVGGSGTIVENGARVNAINNFYASPASTQRDQEQALFVNPPGSLSANLYTSGNFSGDLPAFAVNHVGDASSQFATSPIATEDTCLAAYRVLAEAGAQPRDSLDQQHASSIKLPSCAAVLVKSLYYHVLQRAAGEAEVQTWRGFLGDAPGAGRGRRCRAHASLRNSGRPVR